MSPRLLDLFCGAGGAAMGYHRAGFDVTGVDIARQPHYPFAFFQCDAQAALALVPLMNFDALHASPPCQGYSKAKILRGRVHADLVAPVRDLLDATGLPYVIENVEGAPLRDPVVLEGQMFEGLRTVRPRYFETNWPLDVPFLRFSRPPQVKMGRPPRDGEFMQIVGHFSGADAGRAAMGIDWMNRDELREAIPPAYSEFIGGQLRRYLQTTEREEALRRMGQMKLEEAL